MQQPAAGPDGSPLASQLAMHLLAIMAVAMVGLALAFMSLGGFGAPAADSVEQAAPIERLPYRDDAVTPPVAGTEPDEPRASCLSPSHTAWYVLAPRSDLPLTLWVVPDDEAAALDVGVTIWAQQSDGSLLESGCADDHGPGGPEQLVTSAREGQAYYIGVSAIDRPEPGEGTLTFLAQLQQPEHDLFAFARTVGETPYQDVEVDAGAARTEPGEITPSCADTDATTWYAISSPQDAVLSATVSPSVGADDALDVAVALHTGDAVDALMEVACSDASGIDGAEHLEVPIFGGKTYWLQVGAVLSQDAEPGVYTLAIDGIQTIDLRPLPDTVLGADPVAISVEASSGLPVVIEVSGPCRVADGMLVADGAGLCTVTASQPGDADWAPAAPVATTLRVARGRQAVDLRPVAAARVGEPIVVSAVADSGLPVRVAAAGACRIEEGVLLTVRSGLCTVTATQPGDADWEPAVPVTTTVPVERGRQAIALAPLDPTTVDVRVIELTATTESGLPVTLDVEGPCEVAGRALRVLGSGSCTITASQAGDADWAPAEPVSTTVRIARGRQAIALEPLPEAISFGDAPVALGATSDSGLPVALELEGPCELGEDGLVTTGAGSCTITASQAGDVDWRPAQPVSVSIAIEPASQAIALEPLPEAISFGDAPVALGATSDSGLPVALELEGPCELGEDGLVTTGAGSCTITASQAGDVDWRPAQPVSVSIAIEPASQAIALEPIDRLSVGQSGEVAAAADSGLPVTLAASGPCLLDGRALRVLGSGSCTITASQAGDADWAPAEPVSTTVRIARGRQAIALEPLPEAISFGDAPVALGATSDSGLPVALELEGPCELGEDGLVTTGAGSCTITASQAGDVDWRPAQPVSVSIAIEPASQAIALEPLPEAISFGDAPVALGATSDSGLPVALELEGPCELGEDGLVTTGAGSCTITASQAGDVDWRPAQPVSVSIAIEPASQAIALEPIDRLSVGQSGEVAAAADSGLPVTLAASGPCLLDGRALRVLGSGSCTITASQAGDADWAPAEPVSTTVRIARGRQAIALEPLPEAISFGDAPVALGATSDSGLPVALELEGPCELGEDGLVTTGAGSCTITASQAGDVDWRPAQPVSVSIAIEPASQAIALEPIDPQLLGDDPIEPRATATSGLPVRLGASGACRIDDRAVVLLRGGRCTITAAQSGDADWAAAEVSASFRVVAPITEDRQDFSDDAMTSPPGALVGDGARISSRFTPPGAEQHYYAIALDEGEILHIAGTGEGTAWAVAGPSELAAADGAWTDVEVDSETGFAEWVAAETGIHSIRVEDVGAAAGPGSAYSLSISVDIGSGSRATRGELEDVLLDRMRPVSCRALGEDQEVSAFAFGALAGVRCRRPAKGLFEVKLLTFPDVEQLRAFHEARATKVDPGLREFGGACRQGRAGVRDWTHGRIACWSPRGRSRGVLHWTDERSNTYGILRTFVDDNRVRLRLWGKLVRRIS